MKRYLTNVFRATEEENRRVIESLLSPDSSARFLDLGCYDGSLTMRNARAIGTRDVWGVEVAVERADEAARRGVKVTDADLNYPLPLPDGAFDVIVANQVIEHLYDTDTFLQEIGRLLAPGGYVVLSTNNLASAHNIASLLIGRQPPPCHVSGRFITGNEFDPAYGSELEHPAMAHLRIFAYAGLRALVQRYGFRADLYRTVGLYPLPPRFARHVTRFVPTYGAFLTCRLSKEP